MNMVHVEKYNTAWPSWFEEIRNRIESQLRGIPHTIEHVGSTAIPGMMAKPIIDIVIDSGAFLTVRDRLTKLSYIHQGDLGIPGREAFDLTDANIKSSLPPHHIYVCERSNNALQEHLAFRDFLRQSPEWRKRLSNLKRQLCKKHANDRQAYIDGKAAMVIETTGLAMNNANQPS